MATLVLSTVGTVLGGPVGGAIGSLLGQGIDQQIFGPGPRRGPRLGDLAVQASSYGTPVPRVFGTMRVAGSIIWSTDLVESSQTEAAKGQPDTVTYSYSVSFAVAVSSRRISNVRRIWADGKLIRTAEGEFTVGTEFRLYDGSKDQPVDPLIASIEGLESTPAYRGLAFAVFENLQLAEFGNRIPFLTFEVEADRAAVSIGDLLDDVSGGLIACSESTTIAGYAAYGTTMANAVRPLVELLDVALIDNGRALVSPTAQAIDPLDDELGCAPPTAPRGRMELSQLAARNIPSSVSVSYYDAARDYQSGLATASIEATGPVEERLELPAVLNAARAKGLAETCLGRGWVERDTLTLRLPPAYLEISPGCLIRLPGDDRSWRVDQVTADSLAVVATLHPVFTTVANVSADSGRVLPSGAATASPTILDVIELPFSEAGDAVAPVVAVAASSSSGSWRAVPLHIEIGEMSLAAPTAPVRAVLGTAQTLLGAGQSTVFDQLNSIDVQLANPDQWLECRDDAALADGANLALVGSELIQFGDALPLGDGRFRLSRLLRGRRGSEWAMRLHEINETFVLLDAGKLVPVPMTSGHIGATIRVAAFGLADTGSEAATLIPTGEALRPPCPVHLRAVTGSDGSLRCTWVRRSRRGWAWLDGVDAPLDCSVERYRITLMGTSASTEIESNTPEIEIDAAEVSRLGAGIIQIDVVQVGDFAISRPATLTSSIS